MSMTPAEMRAYILTAPDPLDGLPIHQRSFSDELAGLATAKALLLVCEATPSLLDVPSREDDPTGIARAFHDAHWEAAKARWPGLDDWLGGVTGFMFGWANNVVRYALGRDTVGNPAIVTIG